MICKVLTLCSVTGGFDTLFADGGATFADYTCYQTVAVPETLTIWLKVPGYSGWEKIALSALFR